MTDISAIGQTIKVEPINSIKTNAFVGHFVLFNRAFINGYIQYVLVF